MAAGPLLTVLPLAAAYRTGSRPAMVPGFAVGGLGVPYGMAGLGAMLVTATAPALVGALPPFTS
ncbi:hypothetical protein [Actinomadura chokoriensis]|uniref:Uncharacterized protein n=1 Tax=Actinomadura chokoriensis TaxID=454156 RepID=A0ABV4R7T3_9ACTN